MGYEAKKTEHAGANARQRGAPTGTTRKDAKKESNKTRRRNSKRDVHEAEPDLTEILASLHELLGKPVTAGIAAQFQADREENWRDNATGDRCWAGRSPTPTTHVRPAQPLRRPQRARPPRCTRSRCG